jgi:2-C-methyl-D-erythritol 4-phosphate cytidylyltransferase
MTIAAILTAAGTGSRLHSGRPKALALLVGEPLVVHAARRLSASGVVDRLVVTAPASHHAEVVQVLGDAEGIDVPLTVVVGGESRQASVAAGLAALPPDVHVVLVHDAARALASSDLTRRVVAAVLDGHGAVVPGLPVIDTVKQVLVGAADAQRGAAEQVAATVDRSTLRTIQTPQGFARELLDRAHHAGAQRAAAEHTAATDDAALVEAIGEPVWVIPGEDDALKITTARDLAIAELLALRAAR